MKWKNVDGSDRVLDRLEKPQRLVRINDFGAQNLNPKPPRYETGMPGLALNILVNRDGSVGIATRQRDQRSRVRISAGTNLLLFSKTLRPSPRPLFSGYWGHIPGVKWTGRDNDGIHPFPRLRMSGAIPLLPLFAFMALTGTALPSEWA